MALKPWYDVIKPREDLREGKPLDASEFAVHLDQIRDGRAHDDYQKPERFFAKTVLTANLVGLAGEVIRRLNGIKTQANAVFNMTTQFGGGKTHALALLYHLAKGGDQSKNWEGADKILAKGAVTTIPKAAVGVFVGTEFDSLTGRGGKNGEPMRKTPWGELAWQLGGAEGFKFVEKHETQQTAPSAEVIREFLPKDRPTLILLDELMNYVSRNRKTGLASQLYNFLQNLSEEARGQNNVVLCVSIPASELEMSAEDHTDYDRFKKLLDRLGKPIIMSSDAETSEIIRRRLFEWEPGGLTKDAEKTIAEYADWAVEKRNQIPSWFPVDHAREHFRASYPFHPSVLSVFERKWQELPRFQQTRGVLKMLALWVSNAYSEGYKGAHRDPLIGLGTAPLDDSIFRTAVFEQIGESKLEGAVTTDICGKKESHATRLDQEASPDIKKARLHRKAMTAIFFESNGGQSKLEATEPEIRLAIGEPEWDVGHIDTVLETLNQACYYLNSQNRRFRFSLSPNLNKLLADRRANVSPQKIDERVRAEIKKAFGKAEGLDVVLFPEKSSAVTDRPTLTLAVFAPDQTMEDENTKKTVELMSKEYGKSARTYKTGVIWVAPHSTAKLKEEARKLLAWEDIQSEEDTLRLDEGQSAKLAENIDITKKSIKEAVWQAYNTILLLGRDNAIKTIDFGQMHSSSAESLPWMILDHLLKTDEVVKAVSPNTLTRKWPGFVEWSTKAVRDAFYASPLFPRLLNPASVKETIARGVTEGLLAYVGKKGSGRYEPFIFKKPMNANDVEISDDVFIITAEEAVKHVEPQKLTSVHLFPETISLLPAAKIQFRLEGRDQHGRSMAVPNPVWTTSGGSVEPNGAFGASETEGSYSVEVASADVKGTATVSVAKQTSGGGTGGGSGGSKGKGAENVAAVQWTGEVPTAKWMTFYTKVLAKYAKEKGLTLRASFELRPNQGLTKQQVDELRATLRELGLEDDMQQT
jgi:hypothetical protein